MLNSLDASEGKDFEYLTKDNVKGKLSPSLIAFWEVVESNNMDIIVADGHPLGRTYRFRININENNNYQNFFETLKKEPLYDEFIITIEETKISNEILVSFELSNIKDRV